MDQQNKEIILIVDNNKGTFRNALSIALKKQQFIVLEANNEKKGLMTAIQQQPDLILLDLLEPKMDGMTFLQKLRQNPWGRNVPVVVLTDLSADTDRLIKWITDYSPAYYLVKSDELTLENIITKIKEVLGRVS